MVIVEQKTKPTDHEVATTVQHLFNLGTFLRGAAQLADVREQELKRGLLLASPGGQWVEVGLDGAKKAYKAWKAQVKVEHGHEGIGAGIAAMVNFDHQAFPGTPAFETVIGGEGEQVSPGSLVLISLGQRVGMAMLRAQDNAAGKLYDPGQGLPMDTGMIGEFRAQNAGNPSTLRAIDAVLTGFMAKSYPVEFGLPVLY